MIRRRSEQEREFRQRIIAWSLGILAVIAIVAAAKLGGAIVAPTVLAGLFALTFSPVVAQLERSGMPVSLASGGVVGFGLLGAIGGGYMLLPSAEEWRLRAPSVIRSIEWSLRDIEREIEKSVDGGTATGTGEPEDGKSATDAVMESGQQLVTDLLLAAPEALLTVLYVAFLCFFLLTERVVLRRFALLLCPDLRMRLRLSRAIRDMRRSMAWYLLTITLINIGLGVAAGLVLSLLGLPNAPLWGAMVGLLNYMPYLGPFIANIIIFAVGFTIFGGVVEALYPVLALVTLNTIEGQMVTPFVVGRRSQVGALSVFLALAFGAWLWGMLGALVATPLLIVAHRFWRGMIAPYPLSPEPYQARNRPLAA